MSSSPATGLSEQELPFLDDLTRVPAEINSYTSKGMQTIRLDPQPQMP